VDLRKRIPTSRGRMTAARRRVRSSAWESLLSAQRTLNPGARPQLAGKYAVAPRTATGIERQGADALTPEVMARLQGGNPIAVPTRRAVNLDVPNADRACLIRAM
jgi:hypothetical protein